MEEERNESGITKIFERILLFLKISFYLIVFDISECKNIIRSTNKIVIWVQFFLFNILGLSIIQSMKASLSDNYALGDIRIFTGIYERNSFEYFLSFVFGYILLYYITKYMFCKISDTNSNENDDKILKALLVSTGSFYILLLIRTICLSIITYLDIKHIAQINDLGIFVTAFVSVIWLIYIHKLLDFDKKDKWIVTFSVLFTLIIHGFTAVFFAVMYDRALRDDVIESLKKEMEYEELYCRHFDYIKDDDKENLIIERTDDDTQNSVMIEDRDYRENKKFLQGISVSTINLYSYDLKFNDELGYADRYRYSMLFIITTLMKENYGNKKLPIILHQVIKRNYEYAHNWLKNNNGLLIKRRFNNISFDDANKARIELENLEFLRQKYEKEILEDVPYYIDDINIRLEDGSVKRASFIIEQTEKFSKQHLIMRFIRFVPIL